MLKFAKTKDFQDFGYGGDDRTKYSVWLAKVRNYSEKYDYNYTLQNTHRCYDMWKLEHTSVFFSDLYNISLNLYGEKQKREKFKALDLSQSRGFSANFKKVCGVGLF